MMDPTSNQPVDEEIPEGARTDWRNMTAEERMAIADDIASRQVMQQFQETEERKKRAKAIVNDNRLWDIPMLQAFIGKVNQTARKYGCLEKLPTEPFPSREAFLEAAVVVMLEHDVPQEDLDVIFEINRNLEATRTDKPSNAAFKDQEDDEPGQEE